MGLRNSGNTSTQTQIRSPTKTYAILTEVQPTSENYTFSNNRGGGGWDTRQFGFPANVSSSQNIDQIHETGRCQVTTERHKDTV